MNVLIIYGTTEGQTRKRSPNGLGCAFVTEVMVSKSLIVHRSRPHLI